ncbi:MAG TPA: ABC transporter permease [Actinomycetota bacterium]
MTATTMTRTTRSASEVTHGTLATTISDIGVVARRNVIRYFRIPSLIVFSTIQPVMFVLLFAYVFGGAIDVGPGVSYLDFLLPGIMIQAAVFGSIQTGVGLADDLTKGMIDRFRSLPMARSAVLAGRTLADMVRNVFVVLLMTGIGAAIGFRFHAGFVRAALALGIAVAFGLAFSWISALVGLAVRDVEATQAASFVWVFPFVFASSAFVPVATMPGWLQAWARANPVTNAVDAIRVLVLGGPARIEFLQGLAWIVGIILVAAPLAVRSYRRVA